MVIEALKQMPSLIPPTAARYNDSDWTNRPTIITDDREIKIITTIKRPRILMLESVLSAEECDQLVDISRIYLQPSTTVDPVSGEYTTIESRRSRSAYLQQKDPFLDKINRRMSQIMHLPVTHGEDLQVAHYDVGGEYAPHYDYFPPNASGSVQSIQHGGQRMATLLVYLNDVSAGGATAFPSIQFRMMPRKGCGLYFEYLNISGEVDPLTLHAGEPVLAGEKWIATKWMRLSPRT